jgi:4-aminobutyrate aminotransferase / (S)-3-amino-2-methylpropionate transaminase / 5-aminovalerate transaminase
MTPMAATASGLTRGDLLPRMVVEPPGPRARALSRRLRVAEAPGINTLIGDEPSLLWAEARGSNVLDVDGNRYVDLTAGFGVAAVGHRHPRVVAAVRRQSGRLLHGLGDVYAHPLRVELAERLAAIAPVAAGAGDPPLVHFGISGAEAVEIALGTALLVTGRPKIVAFTPAYHGLTLGALAATARDDFRHPFGAWLHPHVQRLPFGAIVERVDEALADAGALIVEPIIGREGVIPPPPGWLAEVAVSCRRRSVPLIADEVFTGFGRTGRLFAVEYEGVRPDLLVCGKALGGGLPIAAVVGRRSLMAVWERPAESPEALHTATFVANPLACAAALAVLDILDADHLVARAASLGDRLGERLAGWPQRFPIVDSVRGRGALWGLELSDSNRAHRLVVEARRRGVLLLAGGPEGRVAQVVPPLTITDRQLGAALDVLEEALALC